MALKANEWSGQIAKRVGQRVEHFRTKGPAGNGPKLTAQAVADRCTALGIPTDRAVIAKLEKGLRQTLTVGELMVLAEALGVPPVLLLFPLGNEETVEVLPGQQIPTWDAVKWFSGHGSAAEDGRQSSAPTQLWAAHESAVVNLLEAPDYTMKTQSQPYGLPPEEAVRLTRATRRLMEGNLRALRARIRSLGLTPPALPGELEYIDQSEQEK